MNIDSNKEVDPNVNIIEAIITLGKDKLVIKLRLYSMGKQLIQLFLQDTIEKNLHEITLGNQFIAKVRVQFRLEYEN